MRKITVSFYLVLLLFVSARAQSPQALSQEVQDFVNVDAPVVALTHVRLIDGTGAPAVAGAAMIVDGTGAAARDDQTIVIAKCMLRQSTLRPLTAQSILV